MELHHLRYLLAVAEERHFGRAAQRLFISQPSLSYAIKGLERELGVQLLIRSSRGVEVTDAGHDVLTHARRAVRSADRVLTTASDHRRGLTGRLRIGFEATGAGDLGTRARRRFQKEYPRVDVELVRCGWAGEADALRRGDVDVAWVWLPCDETGLTLGHVVTEPRYAGVSHRHRLADRDSISIDDLAGEPLMHAPHAPRFWVDWWAVNPRPDGTRVVWGPANGNVEECFEQVADGTAACICPASMVAFYHRPDLAWIRVTDIAPLRVALGHRRYDDDPLVRAFTEATRVLVTEHDAERPAAVHHGQG